MVSGYDAKKLLKLANIWQSYSKNKSGPVFFDSQCGICSDCSVCNISCTDWNIFHRCTFWKL